MYHQFFYMVDPFYLANLKIKRFLIQDVFEAVGEFNSNKIDEKRLCALEKVACPSAGSCGGQFTANTMACVAEAIGSSFARFIITPGIL